MSVAEFVDLGALGALVSVVIIDVVLAGDNAVVVALAAAGLPRAKQRRVIAIGIAAATLLRIALAFVTLQLLAIIGLTLAGGLLLLWVVWKMYRELARSPQSPVAGANGGARQKSFGQALLQVVLADVSMSLDNILAVAGTARDHLWVLAAGLTLSVALMGIASTVLAQLLDRHHWIAWFGLAIVAFVALRMIYDGSAEIWQSV
ncbi:MAG: YjbE family putative metal transport protein [Alphaproteobacteria bacterium]|nr:YjbE family putative metal transport protein [Alphaproteobacteria bacterium]